jgi:hypothetical protein
LPAEGGGGHHGGLEQGQVVLRPVPEGHGARVAAFGAERGVVDGGEVAVPGEEGGAAVDWCGWLERVGLGLEIGKGITYFVC